MTAPSETVDALLGHIEDEKAPKKEMNKHYKTAAKAFLEYLDVCAANNVLARSTHTFQLPQGISY